MLLPYNIKFLAENIDITFFFFKFHSYIKTKEIIKESICKNQYHLTMCSMTVLLIPEHNTEFHKVHPYDGVLNLYFKFTLAMYSTVNI